MPLVSTIIPTTRRPKLLVRAINSVLAQTMSDLEVIIVVDGPNPETMAVLRDIADSRLRVIKNEMPSGPGVSRNVGVAAALGPWIAFLDDDDEWLPHKLERQLAAAENASQPVIVSCLSHIVTPLARYVWPHRIYDNTIPLDEYLFDRRSFFMGDAYLPVPSLLMPHELSEAFPFPSQRNHEDWDMLLRAVKVGNARLITVAEPLVIVHTEEDRESLGTTGASWRLSLDWIDKLRPLIGPRAYSGFCLTVVAPHAATAGDYSAFFALLYRAFRHGSPRRIHLAFYLAVWLIPMRWRRQARMLWRGRRMPQAVKL
jgi:glycosyltransferase involved in cell wall biosynthesis